MKQVTAIVIGAGLRGGYTYAGYALTHPDELRIVAVAEPNKERREGIAARHHIPEELQFESYEPLLAKEKLADCAFVCTQDKQHFEPVKAALEKGYHVLCEKPMSPYKNEIIEMGELATKYDRILSVCHVLRYSQFFSKIKELLEEGRIGRLMSMQHMEEVGYWHQAHSFVRGNWRNSEETSPMILAKCCHDMDIMLWLADSRCKSISSCGELTFFKKENKPEGAPPYCLDGCPHRDTCAFYAPRFYLEHPKASPDGFQLALTDDPTPENLLNALKKGPYGRCVFQCDNDVVDHQSVSIEFENEVTASFLMTAFTSECARRIRLMGTKGEIKGDMEAGRIELVDFLTGMTDTVQLRQATGGHSGSDTRMMHDFVLMVREGKAGKTDASVSVESHLMALAAEEARVSGKTVAFSEYKNKLQR